MAKPKIENCPFCGAPMEYTDFEIGCSSFQCGVYYQITSSPEAIAAHNRLCRQLAAGEELAKACPQLLNDRVCDVCIEDGCGEPVCDCQCHAEIDQTRAAVGNALAAYNAAKEPNQ